MSHKLPMELGDGSFSIEKNDWDLAVAESSDQDFERLCNSLVKIVRSDISVKIIDIDDVFRSIDRMDELDEVIADAERTRGGNAPE